MFVENLESLPETMRADFVESEFNGKKGFQHKDTIALANSLKNAKAERDQYKTKATDYEAKMSEQEAQTAAKIEAAKAKALEEARSKGDVNEIEKRYQEQMADLEKRTAERVRGEVASEFKAERANERKSALAREIAVTNAVDKDASETLYEILEKRIKIDPETGKEIFLDEKGGALSIDRAGFEKEFLSSPRVNRLVKAELTTTGGGLANGNTGAGGASTVNAKAQEAKKKGDLAGFLQASLQNT